MSAGKVIGGLLALIGGVFIIIAVFQTTAVLSSGDNDLLIRWVVHLLTSIMAIIGGVLGIASKGGAGALTLIAGIMGFLMYLIAVLIIPSITTWFSPTSGIPLLTYSGLANLIDGVTIFGIMGSGFNWFFTLEGLLIFLGAIIILNSHDRYRYD